MVKLGTRDEYHAIKGRGHVYSKDDCPLCNIIETNEETLIWKGKYWFIVYNKYPYSGNDQHLMAIPLKHKKIFTDLNNDELLEFKKVHLFMKKYFKGKNYFSFNRETLGCRSIEHLHIHFLVGKLHGSYLRKMLMDQGFPIKESLD